jgi:hypothetical protein
MDRFQIVFARLRQVTLEEFNVEGGENSSASISNDELDEIRELGRLALELSEPETQSYTTT